MFNIKRLSDIQKKTSAYNNFFTVKELKERLIPIEFKDEIPDYCKCGGEYIMTSSFTEAQCVDPYCPYKMAYTLSHFIRHMGFKDFGEEKCKTLVLATYDSFQYPSFLCVFSVDENIIFAKLGQADANNFINIRNTLASTPYRFNKSFPALGIPDFGANCKLLDVIKTPKEIVHLLASGKINDFLDQIGMRAPIYKFYLDVFDITITLLYSTYAPLAIKPGKKELYIAITGNVTLNGISMTRTEFLHACSSLKNSDGEQMYELKESKSKSKLSYVIADAPSASEKYEIGKELNILVTADEFVKILKDNID